MKIRNGFVSNSSSSSFILDLRIPEHKRFVEFFEEFVDFAESEVGLAKGEKVIDSFTWVDEDDYYDEDSWYRRMKKIPVESLVEISVDNSFYSLLKIPKGAIYS